ncbi:MAG: hypothetical protein AAB731_03925 [Patescibacteria group bacterium]
MSIFERFFKKPPKKDETPTVRVDEKPTLYRIDSPVAGKKQENPVDIDAEIARIEASAKRGEAVNISGDVLKEMERRKSEADRKRLEELRRESADTIKESR